MAVEIGVLGRFTVLVIHHKRCFACNIKSLSFVLSDRLNPHLCYVSYMAYGKLQTVFLMAFFIKGYLIASVLLAAKLVECTIYNLL